MKARKMIVVLSVFAMMAGFVMSGTGNLYAQDQIERQKLEQMEGLVADLKLSADQKDKFTDFKSSLKIKSADKEEKNMEFVNKLINVMSF